MAGPGRCADRSNFSIDRHSVFRLPFVALLLLALFLRQSFDGHRSNFVGEVFPSASSPLSLLLLLFLLSLPSSFRNVPARILTPRLRTSRNFEASFFFFLSPSFSFLFFSFFLFNGIENFVLDSTKDSSVISNRKRGTRRSTFV